MYIFRLFNKDDALTPVDARFLAEGVLTVGRDPASDWVMIDPDREISRSHLTMRVEDGQLLLHCTGANGVFDAATEERLPIGQDIPIAPPQSILLGRYRLAADHAPQASVSGVAENGTLLMTPPLGHRIDVPSDWTDAPTLPPITAGTMFDAFCEGAGIEAAQFSAEDPADILRRAGAVYRQMVLGVGDLLAERDRVRGQYQLAQTVITSADNNPFKWAPTQRLAIDLLLASEASFLSGPDALNASFRDIKKHLVATFHGFQKSLTAAVGSFDPVSIASATQGQGSLLKGKGAVCWEEACRRHAALAAELEGEAGTLNDAFVAAYGETSAQQEGAAR
jgi:predicted component of type VI protein secretion system